MKRSAPKGSSHPLPPLDAEYEALAASFKADGNRMPWIQGAAPDPPLKGARIGLTAKHAKALKLGRRLKPNKGEAQQIRARRRKASRPKK